MGNKKNWLACITVATLLAFALTGCSSNSGSTEQKNDSATEQSADNNKEQVELQVFALSDAPATDLRFVVINRITPEHGVRVTADLGADLSRVFAGGYTTGGHGLGLRICGDFVSHGYGLPSLQAALSGGYIGARLVRDCFVAWFHWPARRRA